MMLKNKKGRIVCSENDSSTKASIPYNVLAKPKSDSEKKSQYGGLIARGTTNSKKKSKRDKLPNIEVLENEIKKCIIGQDEAVRKIITAIYRTIMFRDLKSNILIIGGSGVGKTETIEQIAKRLNIPYTIEDATKFTKEGYYGEDVDQMVYNLFSNAKNNLQRAQKGIIVIDEIDKKATENDISGTDVLKSLLKIIEGTKIKIRKYEDDELITADFDTSNLIIICMGAFQGLDKIRDKRLNKKSIGFKAKSSNESQNTNFTKQDIVNYGIPEEFMGRMNTLVEMNTLTKKDFYKILRYSEISVFKKYENGLRKKGIVLKYDDHIFKEIAGVPMDLKYGARELGSIVDYMFEDIMYYILNNNYHFRECVLLPGIVYDNTQYKLS